MFATTLTTDRLTLRPLELSDAEAIFDRYASDPQVTQFLTWRTHTSAEETRTFLDGAPLPTKNFTEMRWAICLRNDPLPWGMITAWIRGSQVELGYCLAQPKWGQGIMSEATKAVMEEAWRHERIWRIGASCHVENKGSARVLEKCGMSFEGRVRRRCVLPQVGSEPQDSLLYAQVRDDL